MAIYMILIFTVKSKIIQNWKQKLLILIEIVHWNVKVLELMCYIHSFMVG